MQIIIIFEIEFFLAHTVFKKKLPEMHCILSEMEMLLICS